MPRIGDLPVIGDMPRIGDPPRLGNPSPAPGTSPGLGAGYVKPMFSFINKEYNKPPFALPAVRQKFAMILQAVLQTMGANQPDSGAFAADDMVIWFRNLGFLEQEDRSEERRGGKECVSTCRSRWSP